MTFSIWQQVFWASLKVFPLRLAISVLEDLTVGTTTPEFYSLPKIHKTNITGRPIISGNNSPTERISSFVDEHIKILVPKIKSYVRDTLDFIRNIEEFRQTGWFHNLGNCHGRMCAGWVGVWGSMSVGWLVLGGLRDWVISCVPAMMVLGIILCIFRDSVGGASVFWLFSLHPGCPGWRVISVGVCYSLFEIFWCSCMYQFVVVFLLGSCVGFIYHVLWASPIEVVRFHVISMFLEISVLKAILA